MAKANPKVILSKSLDIPFKKLVLSQSNVRRIVDGVSIEQLAEDIAHRTLLQGLTVRAVCDDDGKETGIYEVPAGGRRFRALELLVKQKRMSKTQPVPCILREGGLAEEDSLAENAQRADLHPLDQFRAFQTLRDKGLGEEEIAARFFVTPVVVKQRLKLAAVSPKLLDLYAEDQMTLEQLMAFTVSSDHERQEQVWDAVCHTYNNEPYHIRRQLTESTIRASDKRVRFVGVKAYEEAGGGVLRDLFDEDDGGWLQDPALLDKLVIEKLTGGAEKIRSEGWKWIKAAVEFPYGHTRSLRSIDGEQAPLTDAESAQYDALRAEFDRIEAEYAEAEELPDHIDQRLGELETAIEGIDNRPAIYDPAEVARAGVFISIDTDGSLSIDRGYVRSEDDVAVGGESDGPGDGERQAGDDPADHGRITVGDDDADDGQAAAEEEEGPRPLSDRLVTELTAHRTVALRDAVANDPDVAFIAVLHALCLKTFYHQGSDSCLEIELKSTSFSIQAPGLKDTAAAKAIDARHQNWEKQLPEQPADLWAALLAFDRDSHAALFAHCAASAINAVHEPWKRNANRMAHADDLAQAVALDMALSWKPTVDNYLGRVTKTRILDAVREARGDAAAQLLDHLKKPEMAKEAERLLADAAWLPEPLRITVRTDDSDGTPADAPALPAFLGDESATEAAPAAVAAE
ncbi:MAG: ParB/RepB/Spo0J family partition protein [Rhodospirillaceae bacterium]|nr:ParB/RepB/Spo0J family partition protein [Rhodospirillaceae bacterium]